MKFAEVMASTMVWTRGSKSLAAATGEGSTDGQGSGVSETRTGWRKPWRAASAAAVRCPTLVVTGLNDMMTPAHMGREVADAIDGAHVLELGGCGHFMMTERPADVCRALVRFFRSPTREAA